MKRIMKRIMKNSLFIVLFFLFFQMEAQELYNDANAASIGSEANSFAGWGGSATESSVSNESYSGSYSIKLEASGDGWYYSGYSFNSIQGEQYTLQVYAKSDSQEDPRIYFSNVIENQSMLITSNDWTLYSKTLTATGSTINFNIYPGSPAVSGNKVYIDHISIVPVGSIDTQNPIAPSLFSNGESETTIDLSWSGATDNTAVTDYKIFKDGVLEDTVENVNTYQVTGLTAETTYQFTVSALDAVGNESTLSNVLSVTTASTSGGGGGSTSSGNWTLTGADLYHNTGNVAIGTNTVPTGHKLAVNGSIITTEVLVQLKADWPDYVFNENYSLPSLEVVAKHIVDHGHLINLPSAHEVEANGLELGEMNRLLLEKIEELTLYTLEQESELKVLQKDMLELKNIVQKLTLKTNNL